MTQETTLQEEINTTVAVSDDSQKTETLNEKLEELQSEELQDEPTNTISTNAEENDNSMKEEALHCVNHFCYKWDNSPKLLYETTKDYQPTELCENFTKGCQWSPDGTCLLVPSEDFKLRIYELPPDLYSQKIPSDTTPININAILTMKEGGLIYDTCWYPFMNSWEPATCCFLSTSRESPIHLWDAFNGELRATYRAYNQLVLKVFILV